MSFPSRDLYRFPVLAEPCWLCSHDHGEVRTIMGRAVHVECFQQDATAQLIQSIQDHVDSFRPRQRKVKR